jgi:hypothetical protein
MGYLPSATGLTPLTPNAILGRRIRNPFSGSAWVTPVPRGKPRAVLEVKSANIPTAIYEARLRGYDRAASKEAASKVRKVNALRFALCGSRS